MGTLCPFRISPTLKSGDGTETGVPTFFESRKGWSVLALNMVEG